MPEERQCHRLLANDFWFPMMAPSRANGGRFYNSDRTFERGHALRLRIRIHLIHKPVVNIDSGEPAAFGMVASSVNI